MKNLFNIIIFLLGGISSYSQQLTVEIQNLQYTNNYIVNPELGEVNINLANYSNGFYTVALVVNGHIIDAKTLVIE